MMWVHGAIGITIDVAIIALPVWLVRLMMILWRDALRIIPIFCVGIFFIIAGVVRLSLMLRTNFAIDT